MGLIPFAFSGDFELTIAQGFRRVFLLFVIAYIRPTLAADELARPSVEALYQALKERRFDEIDQTLSRVQTDYEHDTRHEDVATDLLLSFATADPALEDLLNDWVLANPTSYAARSMRGAYKISMGRTWRGGGWYKNIHPARLEYMDSYLKSAYEDLLVAVKLASKPTFAFTQMIEIAKRVGRKDIADTVLTQSIKADPNAVYPYAAYAQLLLPRWGGSHEAMESLAANIEKEAHPKLKKLARQIRHAVIADRANMAEHNGDRLTALRGYQEANALIEMADTLGELARLYSNLGQIDNATAAVNRCLALDANNVDCHLQRSNINFTLRKGAEALADLRRAAFFGDVLAARKLGFALFEGAQGIAVNTEEGIHWMERAAYFWDTEALYQLGQTYERGEGVPVNQKLAVDYYRACANLKNPMCETNLGMLLWYGKGVSADSAEAIRLWHRAAKKGVWQGGHNLNYFLTPMERVKVIFTLGPGMWARDMLLTMAAMTGGLILIALIFLRRRLTSPL